MKQKIKFWIKKPVLFQFAKNVMLMLSQIKLPRYYCYLKEFVETVCLNLRKCAKSWERVRSVKKYMPYKKVCQKENRKILCTAIHQSVQNILTNHIIIVHTNLTDEGNICKKNVHFAPLDFELSQCLRFVMSSTVITHLMMLFTLGL